MTKQAKTITIIIIVIMAALMLIARSKAQENTLSINDKKGTFPPYSLNMEQQPSNLFRNKLTGKIEFINADTLEVEWLGSPITYIKKDCYERVYERMRMWGMQIVYDSVKTVCDSGTINYNIILGLREDGVVVWKQLKSEVKK